MASVMELGKVLAGAAKTLETLLTPASEGFVEFIRDKSVLIMGFGREGKSTYNYIRKYLPEKDLTVCDQTTLTDETLVSDEHCTLVCGYDYMKVINDYDIVFKSPGISVRDVEIAPDTYVTCQLDMFMKYAPCVKVGITGTKGKTTTSTLTHCILKEAGVNTCLIGNIGVPVFELMDECEGMTAVIEMSSHQLEFTRTSPHIAILTNIYEEHLDHYNGFEGYYGAKLNIVRGQSEGDFFIHNAEQDISEFINPDEIHSQQITLGMPDEDTDTFLKSLVNINPHLPGRHNALDAFFAATAAKILGVSENDIRAGLKTFEGIPHRLEHVGEFKGITFYNDCIATVPTAVMLGVEALERVNTLIIGGMDRGLDYSEFVDELAESDIENIICLPETGHNIGKALLGRCEKKIIKVDDMEGAVEAAYANTAQGKICLISPAASSYNYYKNFEHKGEHYKELVRKFGGE